MSAEKENFESDDEEFSPAIDFEKLTIETSKTVLRQFDKQIEKLIPSIDGIRLRSGKIKSSSSRIPKKITGRKIDFNKSNSLVDLTDTEEIINNQSRSDNNLIRENISEIVNNSSLAETNTMADKNENNYVTLEKLQETLLSFGNDLLNKLQETQKASSSKQKDKDSTKNQDDFEENDDDENDDNEDEDESEENQEDSENENPESKKPLRSDLTLQKMRQSALMATMAVRDYKMADYRKFLTEIENIVSIYSMDAEAVRIIIRTAAQKVNNPLVREVKYKNFKEFKKAVEEISSTKMDFRACTNELGNAAQGSKQTVEQFGDYVAKVLQNQIAAYVRQKTKEQMPQKFINKEIKQLNKVAAQNFLEGISMKYERLKERLQYKDFESLQEAINEAKVVGRIIENEKRRALSKRTEEFIRQKHAKSTNSDRKPNGRNDEKKYDKSGNSGQTKDANEVKKPFICYNCNKEGHRASVCKLPKKEKNEKTEKMDKRTENVVNVVSSEAGPSKNADSPAATQPVKTRIIRAQNYN